jgi:hypothetical protein
MSKSAIGKIVSEAGSNDKKASKEQLQKKEEIIKELVNEVTTQEQPKRKPGRPPGKSPSTSPGRPKTPPPSINEMNSNQTPLRRGPADTAAAIRNKMFVQRLRLYVRKFPEYAVFFEGYNPYDNHPDENEKVLSAFLDMIHSEIEFATAPAAISTAIDSAEDVAVGWAISNPGHPVSAVIEDLSGVSKAILNDKAVSLDIRLLECEISGFLPKNPKLRLIMNIGRTLLGYYSKNRLSKCSPKQQGAPQTDPDTDEKFKNF